jgi:branched-chain amino acid transport system substrate-binding protein
MKRKNIRVFTYLMVCMLVWCVGFVPTVAVAEKEPIKIGVIYVMSGAHAMYGLNAVAATEIAIDEINKAGGVLGRKLSYIARDDKMNPEVGLREAKDLVLNQKVSLLSGVLSSGVALAMSAYAKENKVIFFNSMAHTPKLTNEEGHRYFFRWCTNSTTQHHSGAKACAKYWGDKKVVTVAPDYEYGKSFHEIWWKHYPRYVPGAVNAGEIWVPLGTKDMTPYITKLMGLNPQLVACALFGGDQIAFAKQAEPFGTYKKFHFYGASDGDTYTLHPIKRGEPGTEGAIACSRFPYWMEITPKSAAFTKKFQKKTGRVPVFDALCHYISIHAFKDAVVKAGSLDTEKIIDALEGEIFDTALGKIEMRACDHQFQTPLWIGIMGYTPDFPYIHTTQLEKFANPYANYDTCKEAMELRKKKR